MPGKQADITNFFKPKSGGDVTSKSASNVASENQSPNKKTTPVNKRKAEDDPDSVVESRTDSCLSPAEKKRMTDNKQAAKIKLLNKQFGGALHQSIGSTWFSALEEEFSKPYFATLNEFLVKERASSTKIFPLPEDVWSWTHHFPIEETKVVILGQDPYHGPKQAHGLCFSVQKGVAVPPSLVNMYKELESDIEGFQRPSHGYLLGWAQQGVLLLNACLTVRQAQANSHKDRVS